MKILNHLRKIIFDLDYTDYLSEEEKDTDLDKS